jgi:hypothetical protein
MSWVAVIGAAGTVVGGMINKKSGDKQQESIGKFREEDLTANRENWANQLRANRFNKQGPTGSSTWSQDDQGNWNQKVALNPEQQNLYDHMNWIKDKRLTNAGGIQFPGTAGIDYNSMGLGALAKSAGVYGAGDTGKRPFADNPYSSAGGEYLNYLSAPPPGMQHTPQAQPWKPQDLVPQPVNNQQIISVADKLKLRGGM